MIVLDTTVLAYATGLEHTFRVPCQRLVDAIARGSVSATTTAEVIQEFAHVRGRRNSPANAAGHARDFLELLTPLLTVQRADLERGLDLYRDQPTLGSFDAVLAATALGAGADALVTADRDFAAVPGLPHVVPDEQGVGRLLGD